MPRKFQVATILFLGSLLFGAHIFLAKGPIDLYSPTYDEPLHLTAGYVYLETHDYRINGHHHPPFGEMWAALPLLFMKPILPKQHEAWLEQKWNAFSQYQFVDTFLYKNRVPAERMMSAGRWMQVVLSLFLGLAVGLVGWALGGIWCSFFSMCFWVFSPSILSHGTLVSTDMAFTLFFFLFFISFFRYGSVKWGLFSGVAFGLGLASKYFSVAMLPVLTGVLFLKWVFEKKRVETIFREKFKFLPLLVFMGAMGFSLCLVFQWTGLSLFWSGIEKFFGRVQAGRSSFFMGEHRNEGWLLYFPFSFLMKTPLSLLAALLMAVPLLWQKKIRVPFLLWVPPILFFVLACFSKVQIGHRYILVLYPFLFVIAGLVLASQKWTRVLGLILIGGMMWSVVQVRPHFLPYFNEAVGGPSQGYRYFTDSNVDWGQGLKELALALEPEDLKNGIYLSYFGVADPHSYALIYRDIGSDAIAGHKDDSSLAGLTPTKFAISVTNLQATYYVDKEVFSWLKDMTPWKKVGYSIFIYDFKNNPEALSRLERLRTGHG